MWRSIVLFKGWVKKLFWRKRLVSYGLPLLFKSNFDCSFCLPVKYVFSSGHDEMVMPMAEMSVLAGICKLKQPLKIFEMGTYKGVSSLIMAMNTPAATRVFTLDIHAQAGEHYKQTEFAMKIVQLQGNSKSFDFSDYEGSMDLVFIDADHRYEFVKSDSLKAFKLIRQGGIIVWDDYLWQVPHPECSGVSQYLHEALSEYKINHIQGTRLAIYIDE